MRVQTRKLCEPLDEDAFRPILHHYDGPKFRLELSVPEVNIRLLNISLILLKPEPIKALNLKPFSTRKMQALSLLDIFAENHA